MQTTHPSKSLVVGLWVAQILLALTFAGTAIWKLATPRAALATMIPWAGEVSARLFYFTAAADLAGGLGVLLPSATRIAPRLAALAALGCAVLQLSAIVFHVSRGEVVNTWFNLLLVALSLFVAWGRGTRSTPPPSQSQT